MKKHLIITMLLLLLTMTGCNLLNTTKTMTCTRNEISEEGYKTDDKVVITSEDDKLIKIKQSNLSEMDPADIEMFYAMGTSFTDSYTDLKGFKIEYTKVDSNKLKIEFEIDYSKIDEEEMTAALGGVYNDGDGSVFYKETSLEKFKNENLEGYICK